MHMLAQNISLSCFFVTYPSYIFYILLLLNSLIYILRTHFTTTVLRVVKY